MSTQEKPKSSPKSRNKDRHGRLMAIAPAQDIPMKRFRENIDPEKLELFLSENEKYAGFVEALSSPEYSHLSFASICRRFHVTLHELQVIYTDGQRHLGLLSMANALPQVMVDVSEDAQNKMVLCNRCDGLKMVDDGERVCPECEGEGKISATGDKHARDLMFESMKLTNQKGPLVAIQNNTYSGNGLDSRMEEILKATQTIALGPSTSEVV